MNGIRVMSGIDLISYAGPCPAGPGRVSRPGYKIITISSGTPSGSHRIAAQTSGQTARSGMPIPKTAVKNASGGVLRSDMTRRHHACSARRKPAAAFTLLLRMTALAVVFAFMLAGFRSMTAASSRPEQQLWKYYTTVEIGYGEGLEDVVEKYMNTSVYSNADSYIREVCDINSIPYKKGNIPTLRAGTQIVIPYHSEERK